jgi:hypothetical protein
MDFSSESWKFLLISTLNLEVPEKRLGNGGDRKVTPNVSFFFFPLATEA